MTKKDELIGFAEISRALRITRRTAKARVESGDIPGGFVRYRSARRDGPVRWGVRRIVFDKWLESQEKLKAI